MKPTIRIVFAVTLGVTGCTSAPDPAEERTEESSAAMAGLDPNLWYRLSTQWQGECSSLDVVQVAGGSYRPVLAPIAENWSQYWRFTPTGISGYYRVTNMQLGESLSLDIQNDGVDDLPILAASGNYSGQFWDVSAAGSGYNRLTTLWLGSGKSLDILNDGTTSPNHPILATTGNYSGQSWRIEPWQAVMPPPASLALSSFYTKYLDADGIPIVASNDPSNAALYKARSIAIHMLEGQPAVRAQIIAHGGHISIIGKDQQESDIPERANLGCPTGGCVINGQTVSPQTWWDQRVRGLGATLQNPTTTFAEDNLLCIDPIDRYPAEDISIHEFTHTIHKLGLVFVYPTFQSELNATFDSAIAAGLWQNTYAASDPSGDPSRRAEEYLAEGLETWFNVNAYAYPANGVHNQVSTRPALQSYDPGLYNLIAKYFPNDWNSCSCH
jgi:hypothetical protein